MAMTPEGKVKKRCVSVLKEYGAYQFFPVASGYGRVGIPDIIACMRGKFLAIECKAGKNVPTLLQEREIEAIKQAGGEAMVIREDNIDTLIAWLEKHNG